MVTIFTCKIKDKEKERGTLELARNGAKRLKLCKHPNVVQVKETLEIENGNEITIHVVTVRCAACVINRRAKRRAMTRSLVVIFFRHHRRVTWFNVEEEEEDEIDANNASSKWLLSLRRTGADLPPAARR